MVHSWAAGTLRYVCRLLFRVYLRARHETRLAIHDHMLARLDATLDHREITNGLADRHRAHVRVLFAVHDVHVRPFLPIQHGSRRNRDRSAMHIELHGDSDVFTWPKRA